MDKGLKIRDKGWGMGACEVDTSLKNVIAKMGNKDEGKYPVKKAAVVGEMKWPNLLSNKFL